MKYYEMVDRKYNVLERNRKIVFLSTQSQYFMTKSKPMKKIYMQNYL